MPIHCAIRKYGVASFSVSTIANAESISELNNLEAKFIKERGTLAPTGYNLKSGGGNSRHHPDTIAKMAAIHRGKPLSAEHRAKLSAAGKGKQNALGVKHSAETRARASAVRKGKPHPLIGHPISEETKAKISAANKGKGHAQSAETRLKIAATSKGHLVSTETREKLRTAHTGKVLSAETCARMSAANKGKVISAEHRAKLSAALKGRPSGRLGESVSAEVRARISASLKGRIPWNKDKVLGPLSAEHRSKISIKKLQRDALARSNAI